LRGKEKNGELMWSLGPRQMNDQVVNTGQGEILENEGYDLGIFWRLYIEHWIYD
jgi:hypothetical protein